LAKTKNAARQAQTPAGDRKSVDDESGQLSTTPPAVVDCLRDPSLRPYHVAARDPDAAWHASEVDVLGFDARALHRALDAWRNERKNEESAKAEAVDRARAELVALKQTWAPERIADRRWAEALKLLHAALDASLPLARVRVHEESRLGSSTVERANAVERLVVALEAAHSEVRQLEAMHTAYANDPLKPVEQRGRAPKGALGSIEATLHGAGFTFREIADFSGTTAHGVEQRVATYRARLSE
jgi:hypothetical protein